MYDLTLLVITIENMVEDKMANEKLIKWLYLISTPLKSGPFTIRY
jgi:hypothetical protein